MKWTRWPPYLAQKSTGSACEDKVVATLENSTRGVAGLGSDSMPIDCCGGAPSAGCRVDARMRIELAGVNNPPSVPPRLAAAPATTNKSLQNDGLGCDG
jgi:hypothetical protein